MKINKKLKLAIFSSAFLIIVVFVGATITDAGTLTPPGAAAKTMYTLGNLYTLLTTGAVTASTDFTTPSSVSATFYSLSDLVTAFNDRLKDNISAANGSKTFSIPDGYYFSKTATANDTDLTESNIATGVDIFGVTGTGIIALGNAGFGDVLATATFSSSTAANVTGTIPVATGDTVVASSSAQSTSLVLTVPQGYYSGANSVTVSTSSANFTAANIKSGSYIFGLTGTVYPAATLITGQTKCYNETGWEINPCSNATTTAGQDANYQKGLAPSYTDNNNNTITDNTTGLMWKKCSEGLSGASCGTGSATTMPWATALATCEADVTTGGQTDWRLPNVKELQSIVSYSRASPAINVTAFPATQSNSYWSATTYQFPGSEDDAWGVNFVNGYTSNGSKTNSYRVRCVRGG
jgi:hypothetical protein